MSLKVQNLSVSFGGVPILQNVSFEAQRGEVLALVGPNGAGKTTLLKAIAALIPFSGAVVWEGEALAGMNASERACRLSYLPQGHVAHWPISVRDVVAIGRAPRASSIARLSKADDTAIDRALHEVGMAGFAARPITELSGGERARVMLARALAAGAPLLLADEPTASLDPAHQLGVMALLRDIAAQSRLVIAVIHDLTLAARFADKVLVLDEGKIAASGSVQQTLTEPMMRRVFQVESAPVIVDGIELQIPTKSVAPPVTTSLI
ncbi:MAG: ABC transporter ATP-binding protein [Chitinophagales bacterium]|nr:ABC transporter ATP-binding protein [Hyphomicrobiales bacterium]